MNGQNPNNQLNQQPGTTPGINSGTVLGSVPPTNTQPTPPVTPTPNVPPVNPAPTPQPAAPNPNPTVATPNVAPASAPNQNMATPAPSAPTAQMPNVNQTPGVNVEQSTPVTPAAQTTPVAQPIPGTSATPYQANSLTGDTVGVGTPSVGQDNLNVNGFVEPNKNESIGAVPPPNNIQSDKNKKKSKIPMNKTLFTIIIIVLIAAVAFGVYYFLSISNKTTVAPKTVSIGVGETLSDNISDYATINGKDASSCVLNTRNVDTSTIGEYEFTITCGSDVYKGKVQVSDLTAPTFLLNTVYVPVNGSVAVDDFIESCEDPSNCKTSFVNEETVKNYLATAGGPYTVEINVADDAGNSTVAEGQLYVTSGEIQLFKNCESPKTQVEGYQAEKTVSDYMPMGRSTDVGIVYLGVSQRIYTYTFTDATEYQEVVGNKESTLTFDGITGQAAYNDEDLSFQIVTDLSLDTLNTEAGGTFATTYNDVDNYYKGLGYICNNTLYNQ